MVWVMSTEDGSKQAEYELKAAPVWDGLAFAGDRLFVSTMDGALVCMSKSQ